MLELSTDQRLKLLDLIEQVIDRTPISNAILKDRLVVYQFLFLSRDTPKMVHGFLKALEPDQWSQLTQQDVLTEEVMLELHLMFGFSEHDLAAWLRGLSYGAVEFFKGIAEQKQVLDLDRVILKSRYHAYFINDVLIDELPKYFDSLEKLLEYALKERISYKQYRTILALLPLEAAAVSEAMNQLVKDHHVLTKITRSNQVLAFRVFCALFDFLPKSDQMMSGVNQVLDQLLLNSSLEKTMQLIDSMPYPIILQLIQRYIRQGQTIVLDHLNDHLPQFHYGTIRKIVRRHSLKVNYSYD